MTNCIGSVISVDCGEFGYYQGRLISLDADSKDIVLGSAFKEGIPLGKNVTLNGAQISIARKPLKIGIEEVVCTHGQRLLFKIKQTELHHRGNLALSVLLAKRDSEPISLDQLVNCEQDISTLMGFTGFNTTKNKKVHVNYDGAVKINKPRRYRQYMNRKGGFNRPLDYIA
ncbi:hypothetical protein TELCIR_07436 [Teladorsagia circumcincta]|uniref:U4/U6.U5 small nuclear ribonucleoprotein 27 kDa protein n=1 Tax=Teladorsagia circumcincta TaxID=45464 RepID=A0A2G9UKN6_TELCI|nr:hypothetical protein TELCIR_07436 [Teladorsagia circumcincta]